MAPCFAIALSLSLFKITDAGALSRSQTGSEQSFLSTAIGRSGPELEANAVKPYGHPGWLSSCRAIYLDVGSNKGVQVRKLYEAEKYVGASILEKFDQVYGPPSRRESPSSHSGLCALGLEPNPKHQPRLREIEKAYKRRGWNVHFYPFAAWSAEGEMGFSVTGKRGDNELDAAFGAHLDYLQAGSDYTVRTVDLSAFVASLPTNTVKLMKLDIEGAEYETLASMMQKSALCTNVVEEALIEVHAWGDIKDWVSGSGGKSISHGVHPRSFEAIKQRMSGLLSSGACGGKVTGVSELDDESYAIDVDEDFFGSQRGSLMSNIAARNSRTLEGPVSADLFGMEPAEPDDLILAQSQHPFGHPAWLSKCTSIFLDVGSNMGVQVRKLFEPELYPDAPFIQEFDDSFGSAAERRAPATESGLCALGLEPNPEHLDRLRAIETAYKSRGWHAHFYPFAAWGSEGQMGFNMTGRRNNAEDGTNLDAHLDAKSAGFDDPAVSDFTVRTIDLAAFVASLPAPVKIMKMDIEGAEYTTLASMLRRHSLCASRVQRAFIEVHAWGEIKDWSQGGNGMMALGLGGVHPRSFDAVQQRMKDLDSSGTCEGPVTDVSELDDETFSQDVDDNFGDSL